MICSPIDFVYVYVLGQPQCVARSMPASTSLSATQRRRTFASSASNAGPVVGSAARDEVLLRVLAELALAERVVAAMVRLRNDVETIGDLAVGIPQLAAELLAARERVRAGSVLLDGALAESGRVASARVHQRRVAEVPREVDEVLRAEGVCVERFVERRVEVDHACDVDDRVDTAERRDVDAAERLADVSLDGHDLLAEERLVALAELLAQRPEGLARSDGLPEALLTAGRIALADDQVDPPELGKAVE